MRNFNQKQIARQNLAGAIDLDIIAHEFSHAEFYERIGFCKFNYKIPGWFKHGLAMQNDYRDYYAEDTLKVKTDNFKNLPDIRSFKSDRQFYAGTRAQIMLNYMAAKHEIKNWYTKDKLHSLLKTSIQTRHLKRHSDNKSAADRGILCKTVREAGLLLQKVNFFPKG